MSFEDSSWLAGCKTLVERELAIGKFWKSENIFEESLKKNAGGEPFVFYEGPPTANGMPHPGHVLTRVVKDVFPRYMSMMGRDVPRKAGWDTHGLPVEIEVEKDLGLESKEDIVKYGVEPFVRKCMDSVFRYTKEWEELTERIGFWVDLPSAYVTYKREYVESVWWILKQLWEKELLYRGQKILPWCPRCGTGLSSHEVGWGYKTVDDPAITVAFKVKDSGDENLHLVAWTTTPWTLLSNAALAVQPKAKYGYVEKDGKTYILAAELIESIFGEGVKPTKTVDGSELVGLTYEPLFPCDVDDVPSGGSSNAQSGESTPPSDATSSVSSSAQPGAPGAWRVLGAEFVTLEDGTGIVHIAPSFGADDQQVGRDNKLPMITRTESNGKMSEDTGAFAGMWIKDADKEIIRDLKERGLLVKRDQIKHEYPHCWRCDSPLLYYPRGGWFIATTKYRDRMLELNEEIKWLPEHIKNGRFGNFLADNVDWALSRERFWGTPLPIWHCDQCKFTEAVSGLDELKSKDATGFEMFEDAKAKDPTLDDNLAIHKPYIDSVEYPCPRCSSVMRRQPEVIDCWFDSGAMPMAQWGYPNGKNADEFEKSFPADFISEAIDQTRGWFYSMLAISTMLFDKIPYKNCVVLGLVCDEAGYKMSKSKGNYVEPSVILNAQGSDAMRWYFLSANQPWTSMRFSDNNVSLASKDFLIKLRNVFQFFKIYAELDGFNPTESVAPAVEERNLLDRWILSELSQTIDDVHKGLSSLDAYNAARSLSAFTESLSNWYLRRSRSRFWAKGLQTDKTGAYWTLYEALTTMAKLIAPFTPFLAEELYQTLVVNVQGDAAPKSVHLCDFPTAEEFPRDEKLARAMTLAREIAALGRAARSESKVKVRMPLSSATVVAPDSSDAELIEDLLGIAEEELNVKEVVVARTDPKEVNFQIKPNFRTLGKKLGKKVKTLAAVLAKVDGLALRSELSSTGQYVIALEGEDITLTKDDLDIRASAAEGFVAAAGSKVLLILNTELTPELLQEGYARELVSRIQNMRKNSDLQYDERINTCISGPDELQEAIAKFGDYIKRETLTAEILDACPSAPVAEETVSVDEFEVTIKIAKV